MQAAGRPRSTHTGGRGRGRPGRRSGDPGRARQRAVRRRARRVRRLLRDPAFVDKAAAQVWAHLLDEGIYLCSQSTMYRILRERASRGSGAGRPPTRRRSSRSWWPTGRAGVVLGHHQTAGPARGVWYDLYVMLDIFSRYVVGWRVEQTETAELATEFIADIIASTASRGRCTPTGAPR